jgi:hypothetical protein
LLKHDHDSVKALFARIDAAEEMTRREILEQLRSVLEIDAIIEEEIFYPATR